MGGLTGDGAGANEGTIMAASAKATTENLPSSANLPSRLHHTAYVAKDLEATRKFYEDIIGLPLVQTWCEVDELFGAERVYCHLFF